MTFAVRISLTFALASALAYIATPYAIALAERLQFFDKPVGYKSHARPTPYLGGAAVMSGFFLAVAVAAGHWSRTAPLLGGAALLWALGTIDDRRTVRPLARVLVEVALGALVWATGLGWHLHAGAALDLALTCLWVLGVVNAFNLFDNMDGAAGTMALVVSAGAALIGVVRGDVWLAVSAAALCGACVGFLPRNLSVPARIFLGDGGSMPLGFAVAVLVMGAAGSSGVSWRSLLVALLLVGVPALDTTLVIVSRRRRGVSVLTGGRDHLTHRTRRSLPSTRAVALSLGAAQAALSLLAVLASRGESSLVVIGASAYLLAAAVAIVVLDTRELEEFPVESGSGRLAAWSTKRAIAVLVLLGLGAGLSPFFFTYYDASVWVPVGLGVTLLCAIAVVIRPRRPSAPATLALGGLLGVGVLSLASSTWSESVESAVVSANRWLIYGALLVLALALVTHERRAAVLLAAASVGIVAVAVSVLARMLGGDPASLFLGGRLNSPLGYINGEGCLFALGLWPFVALAEHRRALLAGAGAAVTTLLACLAMLSQSRGTALAILGSLILVLALVPGRTRRAYAVLVIAGGVALAAPDLLRVYHDAAGGSVSSGNAHAAGRAALLAALAAGAAWAALIAIWARLQPAPSGRRLAPFGSWLLGAAAIVAIALGIASAHRIERDVSHQWRAFVHLGEPAETRAPSSGASTRLLSGAGNRYDYWRIAWHVFEGHPVAGVGAGNYARPYYERRATTEDIVQPHSLELQALSELGLAGLLLLGCFIAGTLWGAVRMRRAAREAPLQRALLTAGLGIFTAWLVQASVDWMELLPGLTAIALIAVTLLIWPGGRPLLASARAREPAGAHRRAALALGVAGVTIVLIATGASLSRQGLADAYRSRAQSELGRDPAAALTDANRSLSIDADAIATYYAKAAALARFDQASAAQATLRAALAREPRNFVTWSLLGDIAVRELNFGAARVDYTRAHELNPRNQILDELARSPRSALR